MTCISGGIFVYKFVYETSLQVFGNIYGKCAAVGFVVVRFGVAAAVGFQGSKQVATFLFLIPCRHLGRHFRRRCRRFGIRC